MDYSAKIYGIYLRYVSKEDIHVYSVDECFIDVTNYLQLFHLTAKEMAVLHITFRSNPVRTHLDSSDSGISIRNPEI